MARRARGTAVGPRTLLVLVAVVCFAVVTFGPDFVAGISLTGLGLTLFAASFIFP